MLRSCCSLKRKIVDDSGDGAEWDSQGGLIVREEGSIKTTERRGTNHDQDDDFDFNDNKSEAGMSTTVSLTKVQKRRKTSKSGYAYTGKEYASEHTRGDVMRKGKLEPYAYWPLDRKMVSKRRQHCAAAMRGMMASVVKLSKKVEGQSASIVLSKLNKVKKK